VLELVVVREGDFKSAGEGTAALVRGEDTVGTEGTFRDETGGGLGLSDPADDRSTTRRLSICSALIGRAGAGSGLAALLSTGLFGILDASARLRGWDCPGDAAALAVPLGMVVAVALAVAACAAVAAAALASTLAFSTLAVALAFSTAAFATAAAAFCFANSTAASVTTIACSSAASVGLCAASGLLLAASALGSVPLSVFFLAPKYAAAVFIGVIESASFDTLDLGDISSDE